MGRILEKVSCLTIEANISPCAHICRYCSIGDRGSKFQIERWTAFVERFLDWQKSKSPNAPLVQGGFLGPAYNFDLETFVSLSHWYERTQGHALTWIPLGGVKMCSDPEMRQWLLERQAAGVEGVSASFVGYGSVHDRWNGRRGDFNFLMRTLRTAAEIGMEHGTTLYLTKSSLPLMDELARTLDTLPTPHIGRHVRPFYYIGHGAHHEAECITEEDREQLPAFARESLEKNFGLRSEREWIESIRSEEETPRDLYLHLELTRENIDRLEAMSCDDIFADLETRARVTLSAFPSLHELCETYGDRNGTKIMIPVDIDRLWLSRFLDEHPMDFDRSLLHYHLGRSLNPPPLWPSEAP
jgi:hypothetical protein